MRARRIVPPVVGVVALAGAVIVMAAPSCSSGGDSAIVVHVQGSAALPSIFRLHAIMSNDDMSDSKLFPMMAPAQAIAMPTAFSITLPRSRTGELDVAVDALDATGNILANGAGSATISVGGTREVTITLAAGISLCGNGHVDDGEECDDGDRLTNGSCDFRCQSRSADAGADVRGNGGAAGGGTGSGGSGAGGNGSAGAGGSGTGGKSGAGTGGSGTGGINGTGGAGAGGRGAGGSSAGGSGVGGNGAGGSGSGGIGAGGNGGCAVGVELLANGNFDSGNVGWTATSTAGSTTLIYKTGDAALGGVTPASPSYAAVLGHNLMNGQEILSQPITVPSAASTIVIQGFVQSPLPTTSVCVMCNSAVIEIVHSPDTVNLMSWSNTVGTGSWMAFGTTIDATLLRGATLLFQIRAVATTTTVEPFYFDSLSAKVASCGP